MKTIHILGIALVLTFMIVLQANADKGIGINPDDGYIRQNGDISLQISALKPYIYSNTENLDYKLSLEADKLKVVYCTKDGSNPKEMPIQKNGQPQVSISNTNNNCKETYVNNVREGDIIKIGSKSTYINITGSSMLITTSPEEKQCTGRACNSEITIANSDATNISFYKDDIGISFEEPFSDIRIQYLWDFNESVYINDTFNYSYITTRMTQSNNYITLRPNESKTFYLSAIAPDWESEFKYNVSFDYGGQVWVIDPYYFTDSTNWSGTYTNTTLNATGNIILDHDNKTKYELPNNQAQDGWINMSGNILLFHFNNDSNFGESNTKVYDFSGSGNNITTITNCDWINRSGVLTTGTYDCNDGYFDLDSELVLSGNWTLSVWLTNVGSTLFGVIAEDNGADSQIEKYSTVFRFYNTSGGYVSLGVTDTPVQKNMDYINYVFIANGTSVSLYANGQFIETENINTNILGNNIGYSSGTRYFEDSFDEYAIWNRTLTTDEISTIYNTQKWLYPEYGTFEQDVFDAINAQNWLNLSWQYGYNFNLPDNKAETNIYNINMSENILLMHLDDNVSGASQTISDTSGNGNDGTTYGDTDCTADAKVGNYSCYFDGNNDYIITTAGNYARTISFWAKQVSEAAASALSWDNTSSINSINFGSFTGSCSWENIGMGSSFVTTERTCYYGEYNYTKWNHILWVYNDSLGTYNLYLNGKKRSEIEIEGGGVPLLNFTHVEIGASGGLADFNGWVDEVAIFNRSISPDEAYALYRAGESKILNISVKSCDDASCDTETYEADGLTCTDHTYCNISSLAASQYLQYQANLFNPDFISTPQLWNVTIGYESTDAEAPVITLMMPENNTEITTSTYPFKFNVTDNTDTETQCELFINGTTYGTNLTVPNATNATISNSPTLSNGDWLWFINCTDDNGNVGKSDVFNFTEAFVCDSFGYAYNETTDIYYGDCHGDFFVKRGIMTINGGATIPSCNADIESMMLYNFTGHCQIICNGTEWEEITDCG